MSEKQEKLDKFKRLNEQIYLLKSLNCKENYYTIPYNVGRVRCRIKKSEWLI